MAYNFNTSPYYDDYNADDKFLKILFNPGRAVQARELTQIQSILQNQMSASANHIWKNGAPVVGGVVSVGKRDWMQLATVDTSWLNRVVYGETSNAVAIIEQLHDDETQPIYYFRVLSGRFSQSENLFTYDTVCEGGFDVNGNCADNSWYDATVLYKAGVIVGTGEALEARVDNGIYWIDGFFTPVLAQKIFLDPLSATPTTKAGFDIEEVIVESTTDPRLLDPASGFYNQNAPGGDRYQLNLTLVEESNSAEANKWMWIMDVTNGIITTKYESTDYSLLSNEIAQRTFDESGNYTLNPFPIEFKLGDTADTYKIKVDPSKAYINGYEHELLVPVTVVGDRARTTRHQANDHINPEFGPYFEVQSLDDMYGVFNVVNKEYVIFSTNTGYTSSTSPVTTIGPRKRITHVTKVGNMFRIYLEDDVGLDAISPAQYIVSETNADVYAKLYRPTGVAVKKGVHYPWMYKVKDITASLTLGQVTYSTQKNSTGILSGAVASIPAVFNDMHWEKILYIWDEFAQAPIPQYGTVASGPTWQADLSGNTTALITILDQASGNADTALSGHNISIMADMYMSNASWRALSHGQNSADVVLDANDTLTLTHAVTEIVSVIAPDTTDVTASFTFSDNSTDTTFNDATLVWNDTVTASQPGTYTITYKSYTHGNITTANYFAVNSYTDSGIIYDDVGPHKDAKGEVFNKADYIDFRFSDDDYTVGTYLPIPGSNISVSYDFYLPRKDRLIINDDGKIKIKQGFPSTNPVLPREEETEMTLYNMFVPAYTYNHKNINVSHVKNKRFTMQDIRGIENRLQNLEYYTALNLLEKKTSDMQVVDTAGMMRYKNGILVDPFVDHGIGDVIDEAYYCSIYPEARICTVPYKMYGMDCEGGVASDVRLNNLTYTLDFNVKEAWITQPMGTQVINLNPFARKSWVGFCTLTPQSDTWFEELYMPDVIIENENNNAVRQQVETFGVQTRWNAWQTEWSGWADIGSRDNVQSGTEVTFGGFGGEFGFRTGQQAGRWGIPSMSAEAWRLTTTVETWQMDQQETQNQARSGERSWLEINDIRTQVGDRFVDSSAIPWMRSVPVTIDVEKLRPNTVMHFQFDEVDVDAYITPQGGTMGDPVMTNSIGQIQGAVLQIPSEGPDGVRIRTGMKLLHMKDHFVDPTLMTTQAVGVFTSAGTLDRRQRDILSTLESFRVDEVINDTRSILGDTRTVTQSEVVGQTRDTRNVIGGWFDPVAESFLVADEEGGVFVDSVDLFFWSKDDESTPVRVELRTMINGFPTQQVIPMASAMLYPDAVATSTDGSVSTRFQFQDPIYLMNNTEYCFVVISDSLKYNMWISELGEVDLLTGKYVSEQPYLGSMFTSQNNSTWTPEQLKDIKFDMNICQFVPTGSLQINMKPYSDIKEASRYMPNFQPLIISGTKFEMEGIINGDTANARGGIQDNVDVVLDDSVTLDGSHTIAAGYSHTPISYATSWETENTNISPVLNKERLSTVLVDSIIWDTAPTVKNQKGIYQTKDVKLANPAQDLQMWLAIQEVPNTYVKVYYDTGLVIPRYITTTPHANTVTHGDYNVNDFEEYYAHIYPSGVNSPEETITNNQSSIASWTGVIAAPMGGASAEVSTAYVDGDDDPANLTMMHLVDISNMKDIIRTCFICKEDLQGVGADATGGSYPLPETDFTLYDVGDIWFGKWDDDLNRKFYKKVLFDDGTVGKEEVPILEIDSIVPQEHPDYPIGLAVIEEEPVQWREMKDSGVTITNTAVMTRLEFIEHTFTPLKKVPDEFDHFRIKIELHTTHRCYLPAIREMRVLAMT